MGKIIQIEVPEWVDERMIKKAVSRIIEEISSKKEMTIEELRKAIGVKPEELVDELEIIDVEELREKEKERIKW